MFTLNDPDPYDEHDLCPVVVSLAQQNNKRREEWAIGFRIYEVSNDMNMKAYGDSGNKIDSDDDLAAAINMKSEVIRGNKRGNVICFRSL